MRRRVGDVEEERLVAMLLYEANGALRNELRCVANLLDRLAVFPEVRLAVAV
jgi:hypothetical protein